MGETVLLIIITLINLFLWLVFFLRLKKTFSPQILLHDIKNEVEKLLIEINRTADEDISLIEARIKGLKALIEEADRRMLLLQGQTGERKREQEVLQKLSSASNVTPEQKVAEKYKKMGKKTEITDESVQLSIDFDSYRVTSLDEQTSIQNIQMDLPEISTVEASPTKEIPLRQQVIKLNDEGFSPDFIAEKLGRSITEVQLILDLYNP